MKLSRSSTSYPFSRKLAAIVAFVVVALVGAYGASVAVGDTHDPNNWWLHCSGAPVQCAEEAVPTSTTTSTVTTTTTSTVTVPAGPDVPGPIAGQGYHLAFDDEFNTLDTNVWRTGLWWRSERPQNFAVNNDILSIVVHPADAQQQEDLQMKSSPFLQGYFEARMNYTQQKASWPAEWLLSDWHITGGDPCSNIPSTLDSELDVYEAFHNQEGATPTWRSGNFTLHRNTNGYCNIGDTFTSPYVTDTGFVTAGQWHTYSALWTSSTITFYIDGVQIKQVPVWDSTNQPMRLILSMYAHPGVSYSGDLVNQVDWVHVWQK